MKHVLLASIVTLALTGCPQKKTDGGDQGGPIDPSGNNAAGAGQRSQIRTTLASIEKAAQTHNATKGQPPASLQELIDGGNWLDKDRKDPWGNDWVLVVEGGTAKAWTYGKDGVPGGTGEDEDYSVSAGR